MAAPPALPNDATLPGGAVPVYQTAHLSVLCITQNTVAKATPGTVGTVSVSAAGSATGAIFDCATATLAATASNLIALVPNTIGPLVLNFPCLVGLTIIPGIGQTLSVSYD